MGTLTGQPEIVNEYELKNFVNKENGQKVVFVKMLPNGEYEDGTTLEEMLRVCIERLTYLNGMFPCRENSCAITKMEEALMWLNKRTQDRINRGVEGTHKI